MLICWMAPGDQMKLQTETVRDHTGRLEGLYSHFKLSGVSNGYLCPAKLNLNKTPFLLEQEKKRSSKGLEPMTIS